MKEEDAPRGKPKLHTVQLFPRRVGHAFFFLTPSGGRASTSPVFPPRAALSLTECRLRDGHCVYHVADFPERGRGELWKRPRAFSGERWRRLNALPVSNLRIQLGAKQHLRNLWGGAFFLQTAGKIMRYA